MSTKINPSYTYESVAAASGRTVEAVKMFFSRRAWDFNDIELVACYVVMCKLGKMEKESNG